MRKKICILILIIFTMISAVIFISKINVVNAASKFVIVLDPGHGGKDTGAVNNKLGLQEAKVNYQIAKYAKAELEKYKNVKVYLTRYDNEPSIKERVNFAKKYNADLLVSIHINSGPETARGAEVWVTQDKTQEKYYNGSKAVGEKILARLQSLGIKNRGVSTRCTTTSARYDSGTLKDYYGIIRYAREYDMRSILVEHCFISNSDDCGFINSDDKLKKMGIADAKGIVDAYNLKKGVGLNQISLDKTNLDLQIDDIEELNVIYNPTNTSDKEVTWVSSNPEVVAVLNGRVKGLKQGTAIITVQSEDKEKTATCEVTVTGDEQSIPFFDVTKTAWYYDVIKYSYTNKLIYGYSDVEFAPNDKLTRGQLVTILWRLEKEPDASKLKNTFKDVKNGEYFTDAVKWAASKGIVKGYGNTGKFGPSDPIIRQDLAIILNRYAEYKGKKGKSAKNLKAFSDYKTVAGYAEDSVKWAVGNGIISGNTLADGSKTIAPLSNATRAEVVAMLKNYINKFN